MRLKSLFAASVFAMVATAPAHAVTFVVNDVGGSLAANPAAATGFRVALKYWESVLSDNVTVTLNLGVSNLAPNVIGQTGSRAFLVRTSDVYGNLAATGTTALDAVAQANMAPLSAAGGFSMITSGYKNDATKVGIDTTKQVWDADDTSNNVGMRVNSATLKSIGYVLPAGADGTVTFNSAFAFDYDPSDGITAGTMDFIGVAIHEIGHALGFTSGVDLYDNPANANANINNSFSGTFPFGIFTTLDLFRYSNDSNNVAPGAGPVLDLAVGSAAYFSIDGGATQFNGNSLFSTGRNFGDGRQASHFKDLGGCTGQIGIMDPNFCYGQMGEITAADLAAFDAMGWNLKFNILNRRDYTVESSTLYRAFANSVPEPGTWLMMIGGFGFVGGMMRRRQQQTARIAFA